VLLALTIVSLLLAAIPAILFLRNLRLYTTPSAWSFESSVSVLIPARNEERSIAGCVGAALQSTGVDVEVIVLDDHSEDKTAAIVEQIARSDSRVRLVSAPPLPAGWCGKQFACSVLAELAQKPILCFLDADVRLEPDGLARMTGGLRRSGAALLSGFPQQVTVTPLEQLLLPLMHFLLLGFLPIEHMRSSLDPAFGAGCGQIFVTNRAAYQAAGGHSAIRESRHDGLTLPKAFRRVGLATDLCDATRIASCRMYRNARELIDGLLKNATEGLAEPKRIVPVSLLLLLGQVLPIVLFAYVWLSGASNLLRTLTAAALLFSYLPRMLAVIRFQQPWGAALFHPLSILILLAIQWIALVRAALRLPATWKGRTYSTS
jgi:glycosyltransferase involved in cell wall biosynthesis